MKLAANVIQKHWKGYKVRRALKSPQKEFLPNIRVEVNEDFCAKVDEVRQKVLEAEENASDDKKLCNRTAYALDYLYDSKDMSDLLKFIHDLDVSTRLSSACCDRLIADGNKCFLIMLDILRRCNRSIPHMEIISSIFDVFINMAKYEPALSILESVSCEFVETVLVLSLRYADKFHDIFCKGCSILWIVGHSRLIKKSVEKVLPRLMDNYNSLSKKNAKQQESMKRRSCSVGSMFAKPKNPVNKSILSTLPVWKYNPKVVRFHSYSFTAISTLIKLLKAN